MKKGKNNAQDSDDLNRIESVLTQLFDNPTYRELLRVSGDRQEIMLG